MDQIISAVNSLRKLNAISQRTKSRTQVRANQVGYAFLEYIHTASCCKNVYMNMCYTWQLQPSIEFAKSNYSSTKYIRVLQNLSTDQVHAQELSKPGITQPWKQQLLFTAVNTDDNVNNTSKGGEQEPEGTRPGYRRVSPALFP
eukprot:1162020-Pelagomonas_calceolata.AAC.6